MTPFREMAWFLVVLLLIEMLMIGIMLAVHLDRTRMTVGEEMERVLSTYEFDQQ